MIVVVFRSRLRPDAEAEYTEWAARMSALAQAMPGYLSHKGFVAADGERVTIVEFESIEHMKAWSTHPEHVAAKRKGRQGFYAEYAIHTCEVLHSNRFVHEG